MDTFAVFFTSGTTGLPKGAMVSHLNLEANGYNQCIADGSRPEDVNLVATPLYHMGAVFMAVTYMMLGCTQVILPQFAPIAWLAALERHRATVSLLISTMINAVLNEPRLADFDRSSLRLIFYGGGPMPRAVLERAIATFRCGFTQGYGLTETLEATFLVAADHVADGTEAQRRRLASAGREAVGAEVRIVNEAGKDLRPGEVGEVLIRSRSVIAGYWRQPEETAQAIRDGWFYTGDLGYLDEDRYLFIVDRKKDMVISGGVNIYTKEIESVLYTHPAVREAAVLGLPDDRWGESVTAAVSLRPGAEVSAAELIAHCGAELAGFKKPKRVVFLPELPKNPSGKILKREIRRTLLEPPADERHSGTRTDGACPCAGGHARRATRDRPGDQPHRAKRRRLGRAARRSAFPGWPGVSHRRDRAARRGQIDARGTSRRGPAAAWSVRCGDRGRPDQPIQRRRAAR